LWKCAKNHGNWSGILKIGLQADVSLQT